MRASATRRQFVSGAAGLAGALCIPGALSGCMCSSSAVSAASDTASVPTASGLQAMVQKMVDFGPRLTGSPAHKAYIDFLESELSSLGFQVTRDPYSFTRWQAKSSSLQTLDGSGAATAIDVAGYFPYSGSTSADGIVGDLVSIDLPLENLPADLANLADLLDFAGSVLTGLIPTIEASLAAVAGGTAGAVVLVNGIIPPLVTGIFLPFLSYAKPADFARLPLGDYKRTFFAALFSQLLDILRGVGAVGAIFTLDASPANAAGQYLPFASALDTLPALLVDREVGADLRSRAASRPKVRLGLVADTFPNESTDSLVAILPGASSENMIVNTHTDGQNAFEENGGIACLAIAKHYASIPQAQRPRTLVISLVTGHMVANLPQTQGFIDHFPELIANAACGITIEHLGATEWIDDAQGYHATGLPEFAAAFHSVTPVGTIATQTYMASALTGVSLLRPVINAFFGVGGALNQAGVPSIGYLAAPNYLVAISNNGHIDKLDAERMLLETQWFIDTLHQLETVPSATLKLGESIPGI
jgi:hypothetical protein